MNKITVIGTGNVGATIAYTLAVEALASEIVLIDINRDKALGEALDIRQGAPFCAPSNIYAGDYIDAKDSDIVIMTSGAARKPGQSRLDLVNVNAAITKSIIPNITKYAPDAIYIMVANPVDILTKVLSECSGLPDNRVIGTGTMLDSARLCARIAEYYSVSQQCVNAHVFGEHGDSSFVPWSLASISGIPLDEYRNILLTTHDSLIPELNRTDVETYIRESGARIIARKGATFYAISLVTAHLCRCILGGIDTPMTVTSMLHGEYGLKDVCLSTLRLVGKNGITGSLTPPLTDAELVSLHKAADAVRYDTKQ